MEATLRRQKNMATAMRAIRTATPLMAPPTIAPVLSDLEFPLPPAGTALVVWAGELAVPVVEDDVLEVLELLVEEDLELLVVDETELEDVDVEVVDGALIVVGVDSVLSDSVKLTWMLVRERVSVRPDADAITVVPRELAVPHPYWEKPPPKTFL